MEARALVTLYEARGGFQLDVEALRHAGIGALFEAFARLRAKLDDPFPSKLLHTVRGMGYVLEDRS